VGRTCENIVIRNCHMSEGHGAVAIGSGMSGGVRNVHVSDCRFTGGDQGIRLKSMRGRGGFVENVYFENIYMANLRREAIILNMFYGSSTAASRSDAAPVFRNIHVRDVTCEIEEYKEHHNVPVGIHFMDDIRGYEEQVLS
jgi:polygalacturonase